MKLAEWLFQQTKRRKMKFRDVLSDLADTSGVTLTSLRAYARGMRVGTYTTAKAIEGATGGAVTCMELFEPGAPEPPKKTRKVDP
jgi:DNA-binding transcriptional regulator YdaS (Cro superfamily)